MNILISSYVPWWNAEAAYAATLGQVLGAAGHRVRILTQPGTRNEDHLRAMGLPVDTSIALHSGNPVKLMHALSKLRSLQRAERTDIVDVFRSRELPLHLLAARGGSGVTVVRTRGSARPLKGHALNRRIYRQWCGAVITSADSLRRQLADELKVPAHRLRTIYYPVDGLPPPTVEARAHSRAALAESLQIDPGCHMLGLVGRAAPEKGHRAMLRALADIVQRIPGAVLIIAAKGYPGEAAERAGIEQAIAEGGLARHVRWLEFREDIRDIMGAMDLGVIPSLSSELNCRVAVEFFSVGVPVVAFPTGALPEVVLSGESGVVTEDHSPQAMAAAVISVLSDPDYHERLRAGALAATLRLSRGRFLDDTLEVYASARRNP